MDQSDLLYQIALSNMPGVGDINARKLLNYFGNIESLFSESYRTLTKVEGIGSSIAKSITSNRSLDMAKKELDFISRFNINTAFFTEENYPRRLRECPDSPILIFYKGNLAQNAPRVLSVVGTRNATRKGKINCQSIIADLAAKYSDMVIVSGLAYGVDICAHKASLKNDLPTIGVMAHGFKTLYPSIHTTTAKEMLKKGALLTDFLSDTLPDRNNFLKRNRIIAGMADATIVVESGTKGGAMVTADIALSYNREVLAIPGNPDSKYSSGCNMLIKSQKASLIENDADIEFFLNWTSTSKKRDVQTKINLELSKLDEEVFLIIKAHQKIPATKLSELTGKPIQNLSSALLNLEFSGLISSLPGNIYVCNED